MALPINAYTAGIYRTEIDQSNNLTVAGTSSGALVIRATKGPSNREVQVSDYSSFVNIFGGPVIVSGDAPVYGYGAYAAEEFLKESNELHVVRAVDGTDKYPMARFTSSFNATNYVIDTDIITSAGVSALQTPTLPDVVGTIRALDEGFDEVAGSLMMIGALGSGIEGHNIGVTVETFNVTSAGVCDWFLNYDDYPTLSAIQTIVTSAINGGYASTSDFDDDLVLAGSALSAVFPIASDVVKISVYTKTSGQTWTDINDVLLPSAMTPVETFYGTVGLLKDANNVQLNLREKINGISEYIYINLGATKLAYDILPANTKVIGLGGGAISSGNGTGVADGTAIQLGWDFFNDREYVTVNILICPDSNTALKQKVAGIASTRMDCIAVGQSGAVTAKTVDAVKAAEAYGYANPSYIGLYAGWDLKYDSTNDRNLYVPKALYGAALMARNDRTGYTWNAPAGDPNGILPTAGQNKIFNFTEIGELQKASINTSRFLRSTGHTMWGQRTAQVKNTALNRINVRRLLLYVENTIEITLFPFLFNIINDDRTRIRISALVNNFLGGVVAAGGATQAQAICNEQNNTADIIDNNQMVMDVFIVPSKPVEIIQLNTRIVKTGVSFTETIL